MQRFKIALVSMASQFGRVQQNLAEMLKLIGEAAEQGAKLVCFPEVSLQGYHVDIPRMRRESEAIDGPACTQLIAAAKQHDLVVSVGMALRVGEQVYNAQVYLGAQGRLGYSTKVHLAPEEAAMFDMGHDWPVIDLGFAKVGTVICYDAEFPEAARCLALGGADVVIMSFATGRCDSCGRPQEPMAWRKQAMTWAPARAYENRVFVAAVNHAGDVIDDQNICGASWIEPGATHRWPGYSFVVGPDGERIAESSYEHNRQRMLLAELDPDLLDHWRTASGDFLKARRPETYHRMTQGVSQ